MARPKEDLAFRNKYRIAHPWDEVWPWLYPCIPVKPGAIIFSAGWLRNHGRDVLDAQEVHHIFGGYDNGRADCHANLLSVARTTHSLLEEYPGYTGDEKLVVCLRAKCDGWQSRGKYLAQEWSELSGECYPSRMEAMDLDGKFAKYRDYVLSFLRDDECQT